MNIKEFLGTLEDFYKPEPGEEKKGIGHELEHIKGVVIRTKIISNILNDKLLVSDKADKFKEFGFKDKAINEDISMTVAAFHDIGNLIDRDNHNHFALGIVKGELTPEDILSVPFEGVIDNKEKSYLNKPVKKELLDILNKCKTDGDYNFSKLSGPMRTNCQTVLKTIAQFQVAYSNEPFPENEPERSNKIEEFLKDKFPGIDNESLMTIMYDKNRKLQINPVNKDFTKLTEGLKEFFSKDDIEIIVQAVQDHNIDFNEDGSRYKSRSLYGAIVSDADKDNNIFAFATRTFSYAVNKWCDKTPELFRNEDGSINYNAVVGHILDQTQERFRPSKQEFIHYFGKGSERARVDYIQSAYEYKGDFKKCKGVLEVAEKGDIKEEGSPHEVNGIKCTWYNFKDKDGETVSVAVDDNRAPDIFSEIDAITGGMDIIRQNAELIMEAFKWSNKMLEKETRIKLEILVKIWKENIDKKDFSVEKFVDCADKAFYNETNYSKEYNAYNAKESSFREVINSLFGNKVYESTIEDRIKKADEIGKKYNEMVSNAKGEVKIAMFNDYKASSRIYEKIKSTLSQEQLTECEKIFQDEFNKNKANLLVNTNGNASKSEIFASNIETYAKIANRLKEEVLTPEQTKELAVISQEEFNKSFQKTLVQLGLKQNIDNNLGNEDIL